MSYKALWEYCQQLDAPIDLGRIRQKLTELFPGRKVLIVKTEADPRLLCGCYLSPRNEDTMYYPGYTPGSAVVVLSRALPEDWARLVELKECMHMFDDPVRQTNSADEFEKLVTGLCDPVRRTIRSMQHQSEIECLAMAMCLMCSDALRIDLVQQLDAGTVSEAEAATRLGVPKVVVSFLQSPTYKDDLEYLWEAILGPSENE